MRWLMRWCEKERYLYRYVGFWNFRWFFLTVQRYCCGCITAIDQNRALMRSSKLFRMHKQCHILRINWNLTTACYVCVIVFDEFNAYTIWIGWTCPQPLDNFEQKCFSIQHIILLFRSFVSLRFLLTSSTINCFRWKVEHLRRKLWINNRGKTRQNKR